MCVLPKWRLLKQDGMKCSNYNIENFKSNTCKFLAAGPKLMSTTTNNGFFLMFVL